MITIHADELRTGDVVDYKGELHTVAHIEREVGWAWPVAFDGDRPRSRRCVPRPHALTVERMRRSLGDQRS